MFFHVSMVTSTDDIALSEGRWVEEVGAQNFYREYSVKVAAYNDLGHGPNLTEKVIYSAEDSTFLGFFPNAFY
ncbi:hypothetical protein DPMN_127162 [Dreissena polymorpha]|uniref:Uncharacterized protein n=1 Tax=Dreissena polymorpha TaxID=45954 RepID=A0A9D4JYW5_DREPO|nr:hypothetical protein DPMN_127162 [Dreissena polymorpha]